MSQKILVFVAKDKFDDRQFVDLSDHLQRGGVIVEICSSVESEISANNLKLTSNFTPGKISIPKYQGLVLIGGNGILEYLDDQDLLSLIRNFSKTKKIIGAIGIATAILANAGVLISKRVTAEPEEESILLNRGAEYTGMPLEVDGKIITARDHSAVPDFAAAIIKELD